MNGEHVPTFQVGAAPELFFAVARCSCGWVSPPCYTLAAADRVHRRHVEQLAAVPVQAFSIHETSVSTHVAGGYVATCKCGWRALGGHDEVSSQANRHRAAFGPSETPTAPSWYDWGADCFDGDVEERRALAHWRP